MNDRVLASVARKAIVARMSEAAVIHIIDDDESIRAALDNLLRTVGLAPAPHASVSEFLAAEIHAASADAKTYSESLKAAFPDRQQAGWVDFSAGLLYAAPR
jgi:hypothetical protein